MQRSYTRNRKMIIVFFVVVLALVLGFFLVNEVMKKSICVSRTVSGESERTVELDIDVAAFKRPNSFIIEERLPDGTVLVSSQPKELFNENGRISWMFWDGGLDVKSTKIVYVLSNAGDDKVSGRLVVAIDKNDLSKGYNDLSIGAGRVCI